MARMIEELERLQDSMTAWRREMHQHPELAFGETRTAAMVADALRDFGLEPVTGIGGTGVVAVIEGRAPGKTIALRADMDALPMQDEGGKPWHSLTDGVAHACGHDGHTAALLGVTRHLSLNPPASGRVVLIFQPAEENGLGARAMIADGLLEAFPFDEVYAFHNMPLLAPGTAGIRTGPTLNGYIIWQVTITGVGGHGAAFFKAVDPVQAAARVTTEIGSIVGRYLDPNDSGLITVCALQAGSSHNIVPASATVSGTLRALKPEVMARLYELLERICAGVATATGCTIQVERLAEVPPCNNAPEGAERAIAAATAVLGEDNIIRDHQPFPFTDDMALLLEAAPGAYLFLGQESAMCHNPAYDFDDALLPVAASIFVTLVQQRLG
jgi:hippurate hydrolase